MVFLLVVVILRSSPSPWSCDFHNCPSVVFLLIIAVLVFLLIVVVLCSSLSPWSCSPSCHGVGVPLGCIVILCSSQLLWCWCFSQLLWSCALPNHQGLHQGLVFVVTMALCSHGLVLLLIIMILCLSSSPWSCIPPNHHDLVFYNFLSYIHLLFCLKFFYYVHYQYT